MKLLKLTAFAFVAIGILAAVLSFQLVEPVAITALPLTTPIPESSVLKFSWFASLVGGLFNAGAQRIQRNRERRQAALNRSDQYYFANNAISMRAADARRAGIHPLAALGANTMSFNNVVGSTSNAGQAISETGQNIDRAVAAYQNKGERDLNLAIAAENLKTAKINNEIAETKLASDKQRLRQSQTPVIVKPVERIASDGSLNQEAGSHSQLSFINTGTGLRPVPSEINKERIEDDFIQQTVNTVDMYASPIVAPHTSKPDPAKRLEAFPGSIDMEWNPYKLQWEPVYQLKRTRPNGDTYRDKGWYKGMKKMYNRYLK